MVPLSDKYSDALKEKEEILNKECDVNFEKLKVEFIPKDVDGEQFSFIKKII